MMNHYSGLKMNQNQKMTLTTNPVSALRVAVQVKAIRTARGVTPVRAKEKFNMRQHYKIEPKINELIPLDHIIQNVNHVSAHSMTYGYTWTVKQGNAPWKAIAHVYVSGSTCHARALDYFMANGYTENKNCKMFDDNTWLKIQVRRHLKEVGIK